MKKINNDEYCMRRQKLLDSMGTDSVAILSASEEKVRSRDTDHLYRQDSDFFYLTGFNESNAVLVLIPGREAGEAVLFCRPKDKMAEIWHGRRLGPEAAVNTLGVNQALSIDELSKELPGLIDGANTLLYSFGPHKNFDQSVTGCLQQLKQKERYGAKAPICIEDIDVSLHEMRAVKTDAEIEMLQAACDISVEAHRRAMQVCKPGIYEYQMEAEIQHEFIQSGARSPAYNSIVASGDNACILHYCENDRQVEAGDLVLIDAGCELDGYAADITRTFPASGVFSVEQKAIYELVLKAQLAAIDVFYPGQPWMAPQETIVRVMTEGLVKLGLLSGDVDTLIKDKAIQSFYMHGFGHFLGLDVHDVGNVKEGDDWRVFKAGMVLTIEPGLYIAPDDASVEARWRGIGVRIEDDVLITETGCRVLTAALPKEVKDIEALMQS